MGDFQLIRIFRFLGNPFILALVITLLLIIFNPLDRSRYRITFKDTENSPGTQLVIYEDLDNNGYSDKIYTGKNFIGGSFLSIMTFPDKQVRQWNYHGEFHFTSSDYLITGDFNNDKFKEVYSLTLISDSLFLNCAEINTGNVPRFEDKFITKIGLIDGRSDVNIISAQLDDLNSDGYQEVIFGVVSGFGLFPRGVFAYDIIHDVLLQSPESGFHIRGIVQANINNNAARELLLAGAATYNHYEDIPFHDSSCWLMALDNKLEFLFPPIEYKGVSGYINPFVLPDDSASCCFGICSNPISLQTSEVRLQKVTSKGLIIDQELVPVESKNIAPGLVPYQHKGKDLIGVQTMNKEILLFDSSLSFKKTLKISDGTDNNALFDMIFCKKVDLDHDGSMEYILSNFKKSKIIVFRNDYSHPVTFDFPVITNESTKFSLKKNGPNHPELIVFSGSLMATIVYEMNPANYTTWLYYALFFIGILIIIFVIRKIQQIQIHRKYNTEKKITELQLMIVRNQIDPHFAFNAINSAIDAIRNNRNEEASKHLEQFSQLFRSLVISSDKIKRTLKEELEFTENYLKMEQFRFNNKFQYIISVDPKIEPGEVMVPKMTIQTYAENAVKHGLLCKKDGNGMLQIHAEVTDNGIQINIADNGIGRQKSLKNNARSTGKGFEIMNHLFDLYYRITHQKISFEVIDLFYDNGAAAGTKVIVYIPYK